MRRTSTLFLVLFVVVQANAQIWCTPGATWTYEAGMLLAGFNRMSYTHDTLVGGFNAQIIDHYSAIQYPQPPPAPLFSGPPYISYAPVAVITRSDSEVVFTWGGNEWDTLYWFGAQPGEQWTMAHVTDPECQPFMVADTGTTVIGGVPLRWVEIEGGLRIYERIGSTWDMFLYCPNLIVDGPAGMRCYRDNEIFYQLSSSDCEALVGLDERTDPARPLCVPNPGTDHFTLSLPPGQHVITLLDATGRDALQRRTNDGPVRVDTAHLPTGIYVVRIDEGQPLRWVKQ